MSELRETPTFNVKAVAQETGLKPDTLRAWERRYGLPTPDRSSGGHRLYSQHDIEVLKWLVARQEEGLSISNAVDLWNQLRAEGHDPLTMPQYADVPGSGGSPVVTGETVRELRDEWVAACLAYDESRANRILDQAFGLSSVETVVLEVIRAGIAEIGEGWFAGDIVVQQEHFASEQAVRRLESLLAATPPPTRSERLLLGCPPGELHSLGMLIQALLLRRQGWPVIYLGPNVPLARLSSALESTSPSLVLAAAQQIKTAATLQELGRFLREAGVALAYGGEIFLIHPSLRERIPGHFLGERIEEGPRTVGRLLSRPRPVPAGTDTPEQHRETMAAFRQHRELIDRHLTQNMNGLAEGAPDLAELNQYMAEGILAALQLGDLAYLDREIGWVEELIVHHLPGEITLPQYLDAYYQAVKAELPEHRELILGWLERMR